MKTRSYKELLIILREYIVNDNNFYGMCFCTNELRDEPIITVHEELKLDKFISDNRPKRGKLFDEDYADRAYYWEPSLKPPRLKWIDHHVALLGRYVNRHIKKLSK